MEYFERRVLGNRIKNKFTLCDKCDKPITFDSNKINIVKIDRKKWNTKVINTYHEKCFRENSQFRFRGLEDRGKDTYQ